MTFAELNDKLTPQELILWMAFYDLKREGRVGNSLASEALSKLNLRTGK